MANIAGVEALKTITAKVTIDTDGEPESEVKLVDEVYDLQAVYKILKRYERFRGGYSVAADDHGDSPEKSFEFAKYNMGRDDGTYWEGIDVFMKL